MSILISNQSAYLEIIFKNKNKDYGAFELRKNYQNRAGKSLTIALFIITSFLLIQYFSTILFNVNGKKIIDFIDKNEDKVIIKEIVFEKIKTEKPKIDLPTTNKKVPLSGNIVNQNNFVEQVNTSTSSTRIEQTTASSSTTTSSFNGNSASGHGENNNGTGIGAVNSTTTLTNEKETTFEDFAVDALPEFPGGENALIKYLSDKLEYPEKAIQRNKQGKVLIGFVVDKNGKIKDIEVLESMGKECDEEAIRVIRSMPKWKAGSVNGQSVNVKFSVPINFILD